MKNKKTTMLAVRIFEEEKEKLQDEANARGILLSDVVKEMVAERINGSLYDKDLMAEKKDVGLPKTACPYCAIIVDWNFVKVSNLSLSEDGKYCPNPDCRKLVYAYSEENGWRKRDPKTDDKNLIAEKQESGSENKEEQEFDNLLEAVVLYKAGELDLDSKEEKKEKRESEKRESEKRESEKRESEKRESEKRESEKRESEKKKKEKEKVYGGLFGGIITYDSEEESEEE